MNDLQKVELNMLQEVIRVCNELQLRYYLICGTALGAVKYKGFIPWDDDIDIGLFREDYSVFMENAQKMLPEYLFVQNHITDSKYPHIFAKIRDSRTTYIESSLQELDINHGIYIDIFPLDGYPQEQEKQKELKRKKQQFLRKQSCVFSVHRNFKGVVGLYLKRMCGYHKNTKKLIEGFTETISKYAVDNSEIICNHGNWQGELEYAPSEQYGKGAWAMFEGIKVRIPEKYEEYLTQKYGDWRSDLPKEQQVGHHYAEVIDVKSSYKEYIKHLSNGKISINKNK